MPLEGKGLDVSKREFSEWIGGHGGGTKEIVSDGGFIVGLSGSYKENIESLQILYVESEDLKVSAVAKAEGSDANSRHDFRAWKSAGGKFNINARLEGIEGGDAKLVTH